MSRPQAASRKKVGRFSFTHFRKVSDHHNFIVGVEAMKPVSKRPLISFSIKIWKMQTKPDIRYSYNQKKGVCISRNCYNRIE